MSILSCDSCGMEIVLSPKYDNYKGKIECGSCGSEYKVKIKNGIVINKEITRKVALA